MKIFNSDKKYFYRLMFKNFINKMHMLKMIAVSFNRFLINKPKSFGTRKLTMAFAKFDTINKHFSHKTWNSYVTNKDHEISGITNAGVLIKFIISKCDLFYFLICTTSRTEF